ncbi:MAG TPA: hypothetical protein VGG07_26185 [Solirubrobacteraceae bacterium]
MSASAGLFRFVQVELPWSLGPPDGRYLVRAEETVPTHPAGPPTHVLVFATLGAPERRRLSGRRRERDATPEPEPTAVTTGRATVIDVGAPLAASQARTWLAAAGEEEFETGLAVLNRALHSFRVITADPHLHAVGRPHALVARIGFGAGEEVAEGRWTSAKELSLPAGRQKRARILAPQARLAARLGAREATLACEELTLRARADVDQGRPREAALQLLVALDAALAELGADSQAGELADRLAELRGQREPVAAAAQAALSGPLSTENETAVQFALGRVEAALRARAAATG